MEERQVRHVVEVEFDEFGWDALRSEAAAQDIPVAELVAHAAMYYLADDRRSSMARQPLRFSETGPARP